MVGALGNPWERWVHRYDHTVIYEVREANGGYDFRWPGGKQTLGWAPKAAWEEIYRKDEGEV